MGKRQNVPIYSQVAFDIASKIASGEYKEGERFSGRSLLISQYRVSTETIRRAVGLLGDLGIVSVKSKSGFTVVSQKRAAEYVEQYQSGQDLLALKTRLRELVEQRDAINAEITKTFLQIEDMWERFHSSNRFRTYEFSLTPQSPAAGKSILELQFRQRTGATIVAIQKESGLLLSPGPQSTLEAGDTVIVACELSQIDAVSQLLGQPPVLDIPLA